MSVYVTLMRVTEACVKTNPTKAEPSGTAHWLDFRDEAGACVSVYLNDMTAETITNMIEQLEVAAAEIEHARARSVQA